MINIHKIRIFHIDLMETNISPDINLFDIVYTIDNNFVGLAIESTKVRNELERVVGEYTTYDLFELHLIEDDDVSLLVDKVLDYICLKDSVDDILDLILNTNTDKDRLFYLESIINYKSNQQTKPINKYTISVKHYDDFYNDYPEDIVSVDVLSNNDDYSESKIKIRTYLTKEELMVKFTKYLIK